MTLKESKLVIKNLTNSAVEYFDLPFDSEQTHLNGKNDELTKAFNPKEFKIINLRECPTPAEMQLCDTPDKAAAYWHEHVRKHPYFNRDCECFVVLLLNTRRRVQGPLLHLDRNIGHDPGASSRGFPAGSGRCVGGRHSDAQSPFWGSGAKRVRHQSHPGSGPRPKPPPVNPQSKP